jgi:hypothetical protein
MDIKDRLDPQPDADALARRDDPDTSHAAAEVVNAGMLETRTLRTLPWGDLTTEEVALRVGVPRDSISPRMRSLERKGLVVRVGKRRNVSGVLAITWGLTDLGYLTIA